MYSISGRRDKVTTEDIRRHDAEPLYMSTNLNLAPIPRVISNAWTILDGSVPTSTAGQKVLLLSPCYQRYVFWSRNKRQIGKHIQVGLKADKYLLAISCICCQNYFFESRQRTITTVPPPSMI